MAFLDETGLAELWALVKGQDDIVKALANTKAKIATGSYTGTGVYGSSKPNTLNIGAGMKALILFDASTKRVLRQNPDTGATVQSPNNTEGQIIWLGNITSSYTQGGVPYPSGTTQAEYQNSNGSWYSAPGTYKGYSKYTNGVLSWYATPDNPDSTYRYGTAKNQFNESGVVYSYIAIG